MGEQPMEADGDAETGEGIHGDHDDHFGPTDPATGGAALPKQNDGGEQADEGADDGNEHHDPLDRGHAMDWRILR
jgi:hypothetical protein